MEFLPGGGGGPGGPSTFVNGGGGGKLAMLFDDPTLFRPGVGGKASRTDLFTEPGGAPGGPLSGGGGGPGPLLPTPGLGPGGRGPPVGNAGRGPPVGTGGLVPPVGADWRCAGALIPGGLKAPPMKNNTGPFSSQQLMFKLKQSL